MGQQLDLAKKRLFDTDSLNVGNIKLYPGKNREKTPEQIAAAINKSISQIEAGNFEVVNISDD